MSSTSANQVAKFDFKLSYEKVIDFTNATSYPYPTPYGTYSSDPNVLNKVVGDFQWWYNSYGNEAGYESNYQLAVISGAASYAACQNATGWQPSIKTIPSPGTVVCFQGHGYMAAITVQSGILRDPSTSDTYTNFSVIVYQM